MACSAPNSSARIVAAVASVMDYLPKRRTSNGTTMLFRVGQSGASRFTVVSRTLVPLSRVPTRSAAYVQCTNRLRRACAQIRCPWLDDSTSRKPFFVVPPIQARHALLLAPFATSTSIPITHLLTSTFMTSGPPHMVFPHSPQHHDRLNLLQYPHISRVPDDTTLAHFTPSQNFSPSPSSVRRPLLPTHRPSYRNSSTVCVVPSARLALSSLQSPVQSAAL